MASPVEAVLVLCDAAQIDESTGKVHMLGAGWSTTTSPTAPSAVVVMLQIPWDLTNQAIKVALEMRDEDGHPVLFDAPLGGKAPVRIEATVEAGRPAGVPKGIYLDANLAPAIPSLPLTPGRYAWHLELDGSPHSNRPFTVRGPQS